MEPELCAEWKARADEWEPIVKTPITVPRHKPLGEGTVLHVFVDASAKAFSAVIYAVKGNSSELLCSKTRLHPLSQPQITIPRMELLAARIGCRLLASVRKEIGKELPAHLWIDN